MSSHTPGPWSVEENLVYKLHETRNSRGRPDWVNRITIQIHGDRGVPDDELSADVSLVSAAPDLLSALDRLTYNFKLILSGKPCRDVMATLAEAHYALAKAKGENGYVEDPAT